MRRILFFLLSMLAGGAALIASPIQVVSVSTITGGAILKMNPGSLMLRFCGGRTVHVYYSPDGIIPSKPAGFAVISEPAPAPVSSSEDANSFTIKSAFCGVKVDKQTGALTFSDANGNAYLQEVADGGKLLASSTVAGISTHSVDQKFILDPNAGYYGLGQHPQGLMNYIGTHVHLQQVNTDVAIPVMLCSKGYGIFWNNPSITDVDFGKASDPNPVIDWKSESGNAVDYYVFYGPKSDQVIADYRHLTGAAPMFPRWAWGFWQCKEHYATQQELLDVAARYRAMKVPLDAIIQDWFYWNPHPWGSHQFDLNRYPDIAAAVRKLHDESLHIIISVWAKFDPGSANANALRDAGDLYGRPVNGTQYYDPFKPEARKLYWDQISKELFADGFDGWWLDASEPELDGHWGEYREFKTAAGPGTAVFNAFPLLHTTAVYQGQRAESSAKRVFILTRSAYAGQQRNAAVTWSGDIDGTWDVLRRQVPDGINFTYSGVPYWNTDIGGFFSKNPQDPAYAELFTRWFQFGSFCPMFRVHGTSFPKEMWRFPAATEAVLVKFDKLRYHLLPYIYSDAWDVTHNGGTMMRGLVMDFQDDPAVRNIPDQFMFGPALMACPVTQSGTTRDVYLPAGTSWTDFWNGNALPGGQTIHAAAPIDKMPLYVRAGSILPYGPDIQYATEKLDPIELRVYRGADGAFTLYDDEGDNYDYEKGIYATIPMKWNEKSQTLAIGARHGTFPGMLEKRTFRIVWVSPNHGAGVDTTPNPDTQVDYSGHAVRVLFPRSKSASN